MADDDDGPDEGSMLRLLASWALAALEAFLAPWASVARPIREPTPLMILSPMLLKRPVLDRIDKFEYDEAGK